MSHLRSNHFPALPTISQNSWNLILVAIFCLLLSNRGLAAGSPETVAWWRLNQEAGSANFFAKEGGYDLYFSTADEFEPSYEGAPAPPASMLKQGLESAGSALNVGETLENKGGGIFPQEAMNLSVLNVGITVEGFFNTMQQGFVQALLTAGEGRLVTAWSVALSPHGSLLLSIFEDEFTEPALSAEIMGDFCNGEWNFFAAWLMPPSSGKAGYLRLLVVGENGAMHSETVEWPESVVIREHIEHPANLQIGRSSRFNDANAAGGLFHETFRGNLSDIRISRGIREESDLLGKVPTSR